MVDIEASLKKTLYRITCPDSLHLGEYHLGLMPAGQRGQISQHLADCPHCYQELAQLGAFMAENASDLQYNLVEQIKIWVAKKLPTMPATQPTGAPIWALRGGYDTGPLTYEAGEAQLTLGIQDDPQQLGKKSLIGLVLGLDPTAWQAQLWQNDRLLNAVPVDSLGNFMLDNLSPGGYKLIVFGPTAEIYVSDLRI